MRRFKFAGPVALLLCSAGPAAAQSALFAPSTAAPGRDSLPRWGLEFRLGPYRPNLSSDLRVHKLYDAIYGRDSIFRGHPLQYSMEVHAYLSRAYGLLGLYGRVGFWQASSTGLACSGALVCAYNNVQLGTRGTDSASLTLYPLGAGAVFRYDGLRREFEIPVVFTAKLGLDATPWTASKGDSQSLYRPGGPGAPAHSGQGMTVGGSGAVQLGVDVAGFGRRARAYGQGGNGQVAYLFVEYVLSSGRAWVGKNRAHRLDMTPRPWWGQVLLGFAVDMR